jgi:DNA polymerase I-like protein with 3'-5' exonuclease and polymerase domains
MKTGIEELENLPEEVKNQHPALAKYIEYKSLFKFLTSYVRVLNDIARNLGFIRANYKNQVVPTGRLASGKEFLLFFL